MFGGSTAHVEEVCGFATVVLDDIHRRHRQTGAIDETGDVSIEPNVAQAVLRGFDFARIFLLDVAIGLDFRVSEQRVVVEIEFGIERTNIAAFGDDERVDFNHRAIRGNKCFVEIGEKLASALRLRGRDAKDLGELAGLIGLQAEKRIHRKVENFLRRVFRDAFDIHTTFGAGNDDWSRCRAVDQNGEI